MFHWAVEMPVGTYRNLRKNARLWLGLAMIVLSPLSLLAQAPAASTGQNNVQAAEQNPPDQAASGQATGASSKKQGPQNKGPENKGPENKGQVQPSGGQASDKSASKSAPNAGKGVEIRSASFQNVTPGKTSMADLLEQLGEPKEQTSKDELFRLVYQIGPFPSVTFEVERNITQAVIIDLATPSTVKQVESDLGLNQFEPVAVSGETGKVLGFSYPERGVILKMSQADKVSQIILDRVDAEPFVLRAAKNPYAFRSAITDLVAAVKLAPQNPEPKWLLAELNWILGTQEAALTSIQAAIKSEDRPEFRLMLVRILKRKGETVEANRIAQAILNNPNAEPIHRAEAYCLVGDLMQLGLQADFQKALQHHQEAIKTAKSIIKGASPDQRKAAKEIMLEAHLAVALDIAQGQWAEKDKVLPKWIANANKLTDSLLTQDGVDPILKMVTLRRALEAYAHVDLPCSELATNAVDLGRNLVSQTDDPLRKRFVERNIGHAMRAAMMNAQRRGEHDLAAQFGQDAVALLSVMHAPDKSDTIDLLKIAQLHFEMGSLLAIGKGEHDEAMKWYRRAVPTLSDAKFKRQVADIGLHGERFVSMGVSAWQTGDKEAAIEWTEKGVAWIEEAISLKQIDEQALIVPFGNLAEMHKHMGNTQRAQKLAERVEAIKRR